MKYPSKERIEEADRIQIARWWRYLPSPGINHINNEDFFEMTQYEAELMDLINAKFEKFGGMNSELSKIIGWEKK